MGERNYLPTIRHKACLSEAGIGSLAPAIKKGKLRKQIYHMQQHFMRQDIIVYENKMLNPHHPLSSTHSATNEK